MGIDFSEPTSIPKILDRTSHLFVSLRSPPRRWVLARKKPPANCGRAKLTMAWRMSKSRSVPIPHRKSFYRALTIALQGENFYRDAKKVKTLNRLKDGKPQRNARGDITKDASYQSREVPKARIEPNRKWFANSRVISQESLAAFRDAVAQQTADPHSYLLKTNKLPMSLIRDDKTATKNGIKQHKAKMVVETASFGDTFGPKSQRKRVKLGLSSFTDLVGESEKMHEEYLDRLDKAKLLSGQAGAGAGADDTTTDREEGVLTAARESIFSKGQSKRIWNELYKVMDSSDVVIHVLDARDPLGTRCHAIEKYLKEEAPHKHLVFVLNKCDLVPTSVAVCTLLFCFQIFFQSSGYSHAPFPRF
jgi:nuclear GTP-binding protein